MDDDFDWDQIGAIADQVQSGDTGYGNQSSSLQPHTHLRGSGTPTSSASFFAPKARLKKVICSNCEAQGDSTELCCGMCGQSFASVSQGRVINLAAPPAPRAPQVRNGFFNNNRKVAARGPSPTQPTTNTTTTTTSMTTSSSSGRQSTLHGFVQSNPNRGVHAVKPSGITVDNPPKESMRVDPDCMHDYIFPRSGDYPVREYQKNIVDTALMHNTMVVLPTGLGKTLIAAVVMLNYLRWFPNGKILFLAPTRAVVTQQIQACHGIAGISEDITAEMLGSVQPAKRQLLWKQKRLFYCTPQTAQKDCKSGYLPLDDVVLVVFDEAHRATGKYAFAVVLERLAERSPNFRVLALTATPGKDYNKVQEVINNLLISKIEYKSETDPDVKPYVFDKMMQVVQVKMTPQCNTIVERLEGFCKAPLDIVCNSGQYPGIPRNIKKLTRARLVMVSKQQNGYGSMNAAYFQLMGSLGLLTSLLHLRDLLLIHGLRTMHSNLKRNFGSSDSKASKAKQRLVKSPQWQAFVMQLNQMCNATTENIAANPKVAKLIEILTEHFERYRGAGKQTSVIVFSQFRDSVAEIVAAVSGATNLKVSPFVGQSNSAKGKQQADDKVACVAVRGQNQKRQQEIIRQFRNGKLDVLVATCIGEEGLDIGSVDLIVSFDALSSPVRMTQRFGRAGRKRSGGVVVLATEGHEMEKLQSGTQKSNRVHALLRKRQASLALFQGDRSYLPDGVVPKVSFREIEVNEYRASQIGGRSNARKAQRDNPYSTRTSLELSSSQKYLHEDKVMLSESQELIPLYPIVSIPSTTLASLQFPRHPTKIHSSSRSELLTTMSKFVELNGWELEYEQDEDFVHDIHQQLGKVPDNSTLDFLGVESSELPSQSQKNGLHMIEEEDKTDSSDDILQETVEQHGNNSSGDDTDAELDHLIDNGIGCLKRESSTAGKGQVSASKTVIDLDAASQSKTVPHLDAASQSKTVPNLDAAPQSEPSMIGNKNSETKTTKSRRNSEDTIVEELQQIDNAELPTNKGSGHVVELPTSGTCVNEQSDQIDASNSNCTDFRKQSTNPSTDTTTTHDLHCNILGNANDVSNPSGSNASLVTSIETREVPKQSTSDSGIKLSGINNNATTATKHLSYGNKIPQFGDDQVEDDAPVSSQCSEGYNFVPEPPELDNLFNVSTSKLKPAAKLESETKTCVLCTISDGNELITVKVRESNNNNTVSVEQRFAHRQCAFWIKELCAIESNGTILVSLPHKLSTLVLPSDQKCVFCDHVQGLCVECSAEGCKVSYHVPCGVANGLCFQHNDDTYESLCAQHSLESLASPTAASQELVKNREEAKYTKVGHATPDTPTSIGQPTLECQPTPTLQQASSAIVSLVSPEHTNSHVNDLKSSLKKDNTQPATDEFSQVPRLARNKRRKPVLETPPSGMSISRVGDSETKGSVSSQSITSVKDSESPLKRLRLQFAKSSEKRHLTPSSNMHSGKDESHNKIGSSQRGVNERETLLRKSLKRQKRALVKRTFHEDEAEVSGDDSGDEAIESLDGDLEGFINDSSQLTCESKENQSAVGTPVSRGDEGDMYRRSLMESPTPKLVKRLRSSHYPVISEVLENLNSSEPQNGEAHDQPAQVVVQKPAARDPTHMSHSTQRTELHKRRHVGDARESCKIPVANSSHATTPTRDNVPGTTFRNKQSIDSVLCSSTTKSSISNGNKGTGVTLTNLINAHQQSGVQKPRKESTIYSGTVLGMRNVNQVKQPINLDGLPTHPRPTHISTRVSSHNSNATCRKGSNSTKRNSEQLDPAVQRRIEENKRKALQKKKELEENRRKRGHVLLPRAVNQSVSQPVVPKVGSNNVARSLPVTLYQSNVGGVPQPGTTAVRGMREQRQALSSNSTALQHHTHSLGATPHVQAIQPNEDLSRQNQATRNSVQAPTILVPQQRSSEVYQGKYNEPYQTLSVQQTAGGVHETLPNVRTTNPSTVGAITIRPTHGTLKQQSAQSAQQHFAGVKAANIQHGLQQNPRPHQTAQQAPQLQFTQGAHQTQPVQLSRALQSQGTTTRDLPNSIRAQPFPGNFQKPSLSFSTQTPTASASQNKVLDPAILRRIEENKRKALEKRRLRALQSANGANA